MIIMNIVLLFIIDYKDSRDKSLVIWLLYIEKIGLLFVKLRKVDFVKIVGKGGCVLKFMSLIGRFNDDNGIYIRKLLNLMWKVVFGNI